MEEGLSKRRPTWARALFAVAAYAFLLSMSISLIIGGLRSRSDSLPVPGGVETTGTVVRVVSQTFRGTTYRAVIRFVDGAGVAHTFTGESGEQQPRVGAAAEVSYDPVHPAVAHDLTFNHTSWRWPFYTGIGTSAMTVGMSAFLGVVLVRGSRRRKAALSAPDASAQPVITEPLSTASSFGLNRSDRIRLLALWVDLPIIWAILVVAGIPVAAPIAMTVVVVLLSVAILAKARNRRPDDTPH